MKLIIINSNRQDYFEIKKETTVGWLFEEDETTLTVLSSYTKNSELTIEIPKKCITEIKEIKDGDQPDFRIRK